MGDVAPQNLDIHVADGGAGAQCASVLAALPDWFGIPETNAIYAAVADREPTVVASAYGSTVGFLTTIQHSDVAAEVYVMAVLPEFHRQGIGTATLEHAERRLAEQGVRFLQVKTLDDSRTEPGYAKTRAFYRARGFVTLEVFPTLWDSANPALQMIKQLEAPMPGCRRRSEM